MMTHKAIVIVTLSSDEKHLKYLKSLHTDASAEHLTMAQWQISDKVKGRTVVGVVLDRVDYNVFSDDTKAALKAACLTCLHTRGLKKVEDLLTISNKAP